MLTKIKVDIVIKVVNINDPLCEYCGCGLSSLGCDNPFQVDKYALGGVAHP